MIGTSATSQNWEKRGEKKTLPTENHNNNNNNNNNILDQLDQGQHTTYLG